MKQLVLKSLLLAGYFSVFTFYNCGSDAKDQLNSNPEGREKLKKFKPSGSNTMPKEFIVKLRAGIDSARIKELLPGFSIVKLEKISDDTYHIVYESDPGLEALVEAGKKSGFVEYVQPNRIYKAF